jgi:hypothetical protein
MSLPREQHKCPRRGCTKIVPNVVFACPEHWAQLPAEIQREVRRTARMLILAPERRAVFLAADKAWGPAR